MPLDLLCLKGVVRGLFPRRVVEDGGSSHTSSISPAGMDIYIELGSRRYVALDAVSFELGPRTGAQTSFVTVVTANESIRDDPSSIKEYLAKMEKCDVYQKDYFLEGLIVTNFKRGKALSAKLRNIKGLNYQWLDIRYNDTKYEKDQANRLAPGPYLYYDGTLKPLYRLYDDKQRTFMTALRPNLHRPGEIAFSPLKAGGTMYDCLAVAVPARSAEHLAGTRYQLRVVVKDLYRVEGVKTSLNSLSYYDISEEATSTAAVVDSLIKAGAHILGLTKLSAMIAREEPMDAVDFLTAFNPRGDGYQSPAGSSSGSAAAVASYDWLDCALGTDTSGSGRRPAMVNGVWEFRPSHDLVNLKGMVISYERFDTPCVFSRDFYHLRRVLQSWIRPWSPSTTNPYEIVYLLDYLPIGNEAQMKGIQSFIDDMLIHLSATERKISIRETWKEHHPAGLPENIDDYLKDVITQTYYYAFAHSLDKFRKDYADSHGGEPPYMIPFVHERCKKGEAVSPAQNEEATKKLDIYKKWLSDTLFKRDKEVLIVLPVAKAEPNYRDTISPSPLDQSALDELFFQPILGAPDIVIPIGDIPYESRITKKTEYLPVVANVVGEPKKDYQLLSAIDKVLEKSKRHTSVITGPRMFPSHASQNQGNLHNACN